MLIDPKNFTWDEVQEPLSYPARPDDFLYTEADAIEEGAPQAYIEFLHELIQAMYDYYEYNTEE